MARLLIFAASLAACSRPLQRYAPEAQAAPPNALVYGSNPAVYHRNIAIIPNIATTAGGVPTSFEVNPPLPAGLVMDARSGTISGTPSVQAAETTFTITARNDAGSTATQLVVRITDTPPQLSFAADTYSFVIGRRSVTAQPINSGGPIATCTVTPALPAGLQLGAQTCAISGAPTAETLPATYTVHAGYDGGEVTADLDLEVVSALSVFPPTLTIAGLPATSFAFTARGGVPPFVFEVVAGPGSIDSATGVFTPANARAQSMVQVTDSTGASSIAQVQSVVPLVDGPVRAFAEHEGAIYLGGDFMRANPFPSPSLVRADGASGEPRLHFDTQQSFDGDIHALAYDGTALFAVGRFASYRGTPAYGVVKLDPETGAGDANFVSGIGFDVPPNGVIATSGALYVNGAFTSYNGAQVSRLAKLDPLTGALDRGFAAPLYAAGSVGGYTAMAGGAIFAGDTILRYGSAAAADEKLLKLDAQTGAKLVFAHGVTDPIIALAAAPDALYVATLAPPFLHALDPNTGSAIPGFNVAGNNFDGAVMGIAVDGPDLYVAGAFSKFGSDPAEGIAKLDRNNGVLDLAFSSGGGIAGPLPGVGLTVARALTVIDDALYVGGAFLSYRGASVGSFVKVDRFTGALATGFSTTGAGQGTFPSVDLPGVAALVPAGRDVFVGGNFVTYGGIWSPHLAKLDLSTSAVDHAFAATGKPNAKVTAVAAGSALYVGGDFDHIGVDCKLGLAKLDFTSGAALPFAAALPDAGGCTRTTHVVTSMAAPSGAIAVAGNFTSLTFAGAPTGAYAAVVLDTAGNKIADTGHYIYDSVDSIAFLPQLNCLYFAGKQYMGAGTIRSLRVGATGCVTAARASGDRVQALTATAAGKLFFADRSTSSGTGLHYTSAQDMQGQTDVAGLNDADVWSMTALDSDVVFAGNFRAVGLGFSTEPAAGVAMIQAVGPTGFAALWGQGFQEPERNVFYTSASVSRLVFLGGSFFSHRQQPSFFATFVDWHDGALLR